MFGKNQNLFNSTSISALVGAAAMLATPSIAQAQIDEIIITAQRTSENIQDVPIAVTALDATMLETKQVTDILDLQSEIPNINIATNTGTASAARIFLRGVGEDESRGAVDQAVGIYVDGVYIGRSVGSLFDVVDLEQIEVLRGPQGTLYGRNTIGGAIKLTSVKPQFENGGDVRVVLGNKNRYDLRGTGNLAISDRTAVRVTGLLRERDGFHTVTPNGALSGQGDDNVGGLHVASFRGSFLHEFNDDWSVLVTADQTLDRSDPIPDSRNPGDDADNDIFTIEPEPGTECPATGGFIGFGLGCFTNYNQRLKTRGISGTVEGALGNLELTSISGYRDLEDELTTRIGFPYSQATDQNQFSQEFTIGSSSDDALTWLAGVYYWNEDLVLNSTFVFPFTVDVKTESISAFGQASYDVTDALAITAGLRYTDETKDLDATRNDASGFAREESASFDNLSYTIGADYTLNNGDLVYGKYSTGFKSGGWSPDAFGPNAIFLPVEEETLDSFEVGFKSDFAQNRLRLNGAAFFNVYESLQIAASVPGLGFTRFNVDQAEIKGVELEARFQLSKNFELNGNLGLLDAEYTELTGDQARGLNNNNNFDVCGPGGAAVVANDAAAIDCALDLELKNAPEYKVTMGAVWSKDTAGGAMTISGNISHEGGSWSLVANSPAHARVDALTLINARLAYKSDNNWSAAIWGKNITNEEYYRATSATALTTYASDPITFGIELGYSF